MILYFAVIIQYLTGPFASFLRYDGLYAVTKVFDSDGIVTKVSPTGNEQYTFFLVRLGTHDATFSNVLSTCELCSKINKDRFDDGMFAVSVPVPICSQLSKLPNANTERTERKVRQPSAKQSECDRKKPPGLHPDARLTEQQQRKTYELPTHQSGIDMSNRMK
jgi:hypothetical protein